MRLFTSPAVIAIGLTGAILLLMVFGAMRKQKGSNAILHVIAPPAMRYCEKGCLLGPDQYTAEHPHYARSHSVGGLGRGEYCLGSGGTTTAHRDSLPRAS